MKTNSYVYGAWFEGQGKDVEVRHAVNGEIVALTNSDGIDFKKVLEYGREKGGVALRQMTLHERANALKELGNICLGTKKRYTRFQLLQELRTSIVRSILMVV